MFIGELENSSLANLGSYQLLQWVQPWSMVENLRVRRTFPQLNLGDDSEIANLIGLN